jgi:hypothetical protein
MTPTVEQMMKKMNGRGAFNMSSMRLLRELATDAVKALKVKEAIEPTTGVAAENDVFVIVTSNITGWTAHKAMCSDIGRELTKATAAHIWVGKAEDIKAYVIDADMIELGYGQEDVKLLPLLQEEVGVLEERSNEELCNNRYPRARVCSSSARRLHYHPYATCPRVDEQRHDL